MSGTKSTTSESEHSVLTPLARGLKNDRDEDVRKCPHECHGELQLTEENMVVCGTCRCTPDGVYLPLDDVEDYNTTHSRSHDPKGLTNEDYTLRVRNGCVIRIPDGPQGKITDRDGWERDYDRSHWSYDNSGRTQLAGGYEEVYDSDDDRRPWGVDEQYTFNLNNQDYPTVQQ